MKKNIEIIREAVVKAVPEILELKFGCELVKQSIHFMVVGMTPNGEAVTVKKSGVYDPSKPAGANAEVFDGGKTEIIGRPIQLADVLLTLNKKSGEYFVNTRGHFYTASTIRPLTLTDGHWNLSLPLSGQSPETLQFLAKILK